MERRLSFGSLGNGITVWDSLHEEHGDYAKIAHIATDRTVTYYKQRLEPAYKETIEIFAATQNPTRSVTQGQPVFDTEARVDLFYKGIASTPFGVGIRDLNTGKELCYIEITEEKGEEIRLKYDMLKAGLEVKYMINHELRKAVLDEVQEYSDKPIEFVFKPFPKTHFFCVKLKHCEFVEDQRQTRIFVYPTSSTDEV